MVLVRHVLTTEERARETTTELMRSHWPGGPEAPENRDMKCRRVVLIEKNGKAVWLLCVYEG